MNNVIESAYFCKTTSKKPVHLHNAHQIIFVKKGEVKFNTPNGIISLKEGDMVFFNRLTEHSIFSSSGDYERYVICITPEYHSAEMIFDKIFMIVFSNSLAGEFVLNLKENSMKFENLLSEIISEFDSDNIMKNEMAELLFRRLLIMIYRLFPENFETINEKNFDIIRKLQKAFETRPEKEHSLSALSKEYNMSISSLSHTFKKISGTSVINYLNFCRLNKAKLMLSETSYGITEICEACGFKDPSNFSRLFKQNTGITPSEYRYNKSRQTDYRSI